MPGSAQRPSGGPGSPTVGVVRVGQTFYPRVAPYHPSVAYPEYPFGRHLSAEPNHVYAGVRELLCRLGFDAARYGTRHWNPLGGVVEPGMTVVIKPNFVLSRHPAGKDLFAVITHPSVLRAVADYCWIALRGSGRIVIADAPQYNCDFAALLAATQLDATCAFYADVAGPAVQCRDLRAYWSAGRHFPSMVRPLPGDAEGTVTVDLGRESALFDHPHPERFYGAVYHRAETSRQHCGERQVYEISATILKADAVISVPKLKVHKKVGVTLNTKGLVGMCTNKNLVVHYTLGAPSEGGDQYPEGLFTPGERALIKLERWMYDHLLAPRIVALEYLHRSLYWLHGRLIRPLGWTVPPWKRQLDAGNWWGNDSAWRMAVDLLRIVHFADAAGRMHRTPQRRLFSIVDGVVGGENDGPLAPDPKPAGVLVGGANLLAVDLVATRLMGFDPLRLKQFAGLHDPAYDLGVRSLADIAVIAGEPALAGCLADDHSPFLAFRPHPGWVGAIEAGAPDARAPEGLDGGTAAGTFRPPAMARMGGDRAGARRG